MAANETDRTRMERIAAARAEMARRYAADPEGVKAYEARRARIEAARKREQQRVEHLVFGQSRPAPAKVQPKRAGKRGKRRHAEPMRLEPGIEEAMQVRERWSHKQGNPETHEAVSRTHDGALVQLFRNGTIDAEQLEWAAEIANVHRSITSGADVAIASLEARVDQSRRPDSLVLEGLRRIRLHVAYGIWRDQIPAPKGLVLDMIVGDAIGYSVAARRHRVHNRKAKRLLLAAINNWSACVEQAYRISERQIEEARRAA